MQHQIEQLRERLLKALESVSTAQELQSLKTQALGKKGELTDILKGMARLAPEERPRIGQLANDVKVSLEAAFDALEKKIQQADVARQLDREVADLSLPARRGFVGHRHPLTITSERILSIFRDLGFEVALGPDIESDFNNFQALNIPKEHPARDMQDTFWLGPETLLRTHTSPVQVRTMLAQKPPVRIVAPGAVYRCDSDVTHSPMFHQVEGLLVDEHVSFADLKGVLTAFLQQLFGEKTGVRFRPSFFPFTEPSAEIDIACVFCAGQGCRICKSTGWLEIAGAGMVNPEVFRAVNYPLEATGFAFGIGVERVAMLNYGIDDIRHFYRSDLRFLAQF